MDPDLVRQQEEAQRVASGAAPKPAEEAAPAPAVAQAEPVAAVEDVVAPAPELVAAEPALAAAEVPAAPVLEPAAAELAEVAPAPVVEAPVAPVAAAPVETAPAPKKAVNPNRNALPPMGRRKKDGEQVKKGFFRGWLKFVVLTLVGGLLGAGAGFGAMQYLQLPPEQLNMTLAYGGGIGAVFLGLWALLHFDV
ncbi:hypothetical protein KKP04_05485 [Rhodomicrobium sp. Az07]|uniref:hypothetical protein n=1 Tax=Rhodomicrobium sp. Az07 TaxID=2839034 RepID=UPI001BE6C4C2|nr:hypothetical protein [Rhodomicrobium sp. Az07]MBT3070317.1 hypothetical protein [Rhodomicrobium sp. Az07]